MHKKAIRINVLQALISIQKIATLKVRIKSQFIIIEQFVGTIRRELSYFAIVLTVFVLIVLETDVVF